MGSGLPTSDPGTRQGLGQVGTLVRPTSHIVSRMRVGATVSGRRWENTSVSSLWTPSGDHVPQPDPAPDPARDPGGEGAPAGGRDVDSLDDAAVAEELARVRAELAATPVTDIVANHALGLWQLAVLHLTPEGDDPPNLAEAGLAIDAMAALVEGLGDRLGANTEPLREALAQLRLAYVQLLDRSERPPASA